jgi:hypothetical protein
MILVPELADMDMVRILRYIDCGPSRLRERIVTADIASIEAWFDEALDTQDLKSVFGASEIG